MVAISTAQVSGLSLLKMSRASSEPDHRNVLSFLRSDIFSASSKRIHNALMSTFAESASLKETYTATFEATFDRLTKWVTLQAGAERANSDEQRITTLRNAATNALVDVIMTNRGSFPPEGFTIRTEYPNGAWSVTEIPPGRTTPPGYKTTVETIDAAIAEQYGTTATKPRISQAPVSTAALGAAVATGWGSDSAAVELLQSVVESNQTARERAEAQYHAV
jgi:hypothetical protein